MNINGMSCRLLKVGEVVRSSDVHNDGHSAFSDMVGKPMKKSDMRLYAVYRPYNPASYSQNPPNAQISGGTPSAESDCSALPKINIRCDCSDGVVKGSTYLNVVGVEQEDDGSFTAVTDHWPND